jgi:hypothetical protein
MHINLNTLNALIRAIGRRSATPVPADGRPFTADDRAELTGAGAFS